MAITYSHGDPGTKRGLIIGRYSTKIYAWKFSDYPWYRIPCEITPGVNNGQYIVPLNGRRNERLLIIMMTAINTTLWWMIRL